MTVSRINLESQSRGPIYYLISIPSGRISDRKVLVHFKMRMNPDLLLSASSFMNPLGDRELDLRGRQIPSIENFGVTKDLNESVDLVDNDIRALGNFPLLKQLNTLLLSRNRVSAIAPDFAQSVPNLRCLVLTNNAIAQLAALEPLSRCNRLEYLSVLNNPVERLEHYRLWHIFLIPSLRILDFRRISAKVLTQELILTH